jgi:hypothetical protein
LKENSGSHLIFSMDLWKISEAHLLTYDFYYVPPLSAQLYPSYLNSYPIAIASSPPLSHGSVRAQKESIHSFTELYYLQRTTLKRSWAASMATTIPTSAFIATPHRSAGRSLAICVQKAHFTVSSSSPSSFGASLSVKRPPLRLVSFNSVRCEVSEARTPLIPTEQRWMFEESEINGPVNSFFNFCI